MNATALIDGTDMEIDYFTPYENKNPSFTEWVFKQGRTLYSLNLPRRKQMGRLAIKAPFRHFINHHSYDVVHIHSGAIGSLAVMAAEAKKAGIRKVIVHSHNNGERLTVKRRMIRRLAAMIMAKSADVYCACSRAAAAWMFEPEYAKNAIIINNGIDVERFAFQPEIRQRMRKKLGLEGRYVIGNVGRLSKQKNHLFLLRIFEKVLEKDASSRLLLVGDGEEREIIQKQIDAGGLSDFVICTGAVDDVEFYLQAMDVFVFPSLFEGFGIAALEAEAAGLPVIASDVVPRDVKVAEAVCFLSLEENASAWADVILRYRNTKRTDNRENLVEAGYSIQHTAEQMRKLYQE